MHRTNPTATKSSKFQGPATGDETMMGDESQKIVASASGSTILTLSEAPQMKTHGINWKMPLEKQPAAEPSS